MSESLEFLNQAFVTVRAGADRPTAKPRSRIVVTALVGTGLPAAKLRRKMFSAKEPHTSTPQARKHLPCSRGLLIVVLAILAGIFAGGGTMAGQTGRQGDGEKAPTATRPTATASRPANTTRPATNPASPATTRPLPVPPKNIPVSATNPFEGISAGTTPPIAAPQGQIDKLVFGRLQQLGIKPANVCSDAVFLRRAYLDVIGTLPTDQEAREFLQSNAPDKRTKLIGRLLNRDEFADYWAMKWSDLLRVKAEFPINLWPNAAQAYSRWIRDSIRENKPYDKFARELLTATGSNFQVPPVNFYRAVQNRTPQGLAQAVALAFMGVRTDKWPKERLDGMAAFFARVSYKWTLQWKEEIVFCDFSTCWTSSTKPAATTQPVYPDGAIARVVDDRDPREVFADWLIDAAPNNSSRLADGYYLSTPALNVSHVGNPYFARNITNRIWYWLMGRGIVHEPDDIRPDNPPSNPELMAYLERELLASHYDLKHIYRLILTSKVYQLSCMPQTTGPNAASSAANLSVENFAQYPLRRLDAEVLIDAICQITGTSEKYSSAIPEPYTFIPQDLRSIALPDGSITSSFLAEFGRPSRDTGLESERLNRATAPQRLHMLNSTHIQTKIEQSPKLRALRGSPREIAASLYLTILSRYPTEEELKIADEYWKAHSTGRDASVDFAWALINSSEFLYRH